MISNMGLDGRNDWWLFKDHLGIAVPAQLPMLNNIVDQTDGPRMTMTYR